MSLLFDQNLSRRLPALLAADFPGCEQVLLAGLSAAVVSKDSDFRDLSVQLGPPPKVMWLRVGNCPTRAIETLLRSRVDDVRTFLADPTAPLLELP